MGEGGHFLSDVIFAAVFMALDVALGLIEEEGLEQVLERHRVLGRSARAAVKALEAVGLIDAPLQLLFNETGIVIGLLHGHFMFVLLPLWAALAGLDPDLAHAAANLGAHRGQIFRRIVFPLTLPALLAGVVINFCMNMAAFATPALLGGARARVISYVAYDVNLVDLNWPLGAAMATGLLAVTLALVWLSQRITVSGKRRIVFEGAR